MPYFSIERCTKRSLVIHEIVIKNLVPGNLLEGQKTFPKKPLTVPELCSSVIFCGEFFRSHEILRVVPVLYAARIRTLYRLRNLLGEIMKKARMVSSCVLFFLFFCIAGSNEIKPQPAMASQENTSIVVEPNKVWGPDGTIVSSLPRPHNNRCWSDIGNGEKIFVWGPYAQKLDADGTIKWQVDGGTIVDTLPCSMIDIMDTVVISDGYGGVISVLLRLNEWQYDIFAQRIDSNGTKLWQEAGVPIATRCFFNGCFNQKSKAQAVSDGTGGAIITWFEAADGLYSSVWAQRVDGNGNPVWIKDGLPVVYANGKPSIDGISSSEPLIVSDDFGGAIIAWKDIRDIDPSEVHTYLQRLDGNGSPQWLPDGIEPVSRAAAPVGMVSDGCGGAIVLCDDAPFGTGYLFLQRIGPNGEILWTEEGIKIFKDSGNSLYPNIISDNAGGAIVAWNSNVGILAQRISPSGMLMWGSDGLVVSGDHGMIPLMTTDGAGGAFITWNSVVEQAPAIISQHATADGKLLWAPEGFVVYRQPNGHNYLPSAILGDGKGGAIISWYDDRYGPYLCMVTSQRISEQSISAPQADLSVVESHSPDSGVVGQEISYVFDITNNGSKDASGIKLMNFFQKGDPLPVISLKSSDHNCIQSDNTYKDIITCNIGDIHAGETTKITVNVIPNYPRNPLVNDIFVEGDDPDSNFLNNVIQSHIAISQKIIARSISGTINDNNGSHINSIKVTLSGNASMVTTTNPSGSYEFSNLPSGKYIITPSCDFYLFNPSNIITNIIDSDIAGLDFIGTPQLTPDVRHFSTQSNFYG